MHVLVGLRALYTYESLRKSVSGDWTAVQWVIGNEK